MKIDCTVVFLYILISYDHLIACDWAKIVSKKVENLHLPLSLKQIGQCGSGKIRHNAGEPPPICLIYVSMYVNFKTQGFWLPWKSRG